MEGKVKVLLTILDYKSAEKLDKAFRTHELPVHLVTHGYGTASSEIMDYLGLGETKKHVILSFITEDSVPTAFEMLKKKMHFDKPGKGIACSIPVSGMSKLICAILEQEKKLQHSDSMYKEGEGKHMENSYLYDLIITIVNQGYSEEVMEAAKKAGARGGTVVHARGLGSKEAAKFLGFTIQPEKDMVLIVVKREDKKTIMEAISKSAGLTTSGKGVCFSLPVENQIGLDFDTEINNG